MVEDLDFVSAWSVGLCSLDCISESHVSLNFVSPWCVLGCGSVLLRVAVGLSLDLCYYCGCDLFACTASLDLFAALF